MELIRFYYVIDVNDPEQIYVGSTKLTLQERLNLHWYHRNLHKITALSRYMKDKQKTDFEIYLIEEKICTKLEQDQIEDGWISQIGLMNKKKNIADPEKNIIYQSKYRENNKSLMKEYQKEYRKNNKVHMNELTRLWRLKKKLSE